MQSNTLNFSLTSGESRGNTSIVEYWKPENEMKLKTLYSIPLQTLKSEANMTENLKCKDLTSVPGSETLVFFTDGNCLRRYEFGGPTVAPIVYQCESDREIRIIRHVYAHDGSLPDWESGKGCGTMVILEAAKEGTPSLAIEALMWDGSTWNKTDHAKVGSDDLKSEESKLFYVKIYFCTKHLIYRFS